MELVDVVLSMKGGNWAVETGIIWNRDILGQRHTLLYDGIPIACLNLIDCRDTNPNGERF
jgi:hypothetical protein